MPDDTPDASNPGPPEPSEIALRPASRPESSDKGKLRVFISYGRDDLDFADQLNAALDTCGFECVIDRHGIAGGEDWRRRLRNLISETDTVVFVLSPTSARSETCAWEVEEATRLGKRILPVVCRALGSASPPLLLQSLNYIFFYAEPKAPGSGFGSGLQALVAALNTDFDWLREHTRYLQRAIEWNAGARAANRLLSGNDVLDAKAWAARRPKSAPEPTALQLDFIRASEEESEARSSAQRKQLEMMAAAQAERETALHEREEALKQAADALRRRARIRNTALVAVTLLAVLAGALGWRAEEQRKAAEEERNIAEEQRKMAEERRTQATHILVSGTTIIAKLYTHLDSETAKEAFIVFQTGAAFGDSTSMFNLARAYELGAGVERDYAEARQWHEKAADKGDADAMRSLGLIYQNGNGVERDYGEARQWYEKAADKGNDAAMVDVGLLYQNGNGVGQDYGKAQQWYEKAADKGNIDAMRDLGLLYQNGNGVGQDYGKARQWYEKAADKGNDAAMVDVGVLYNNGLGAKQNYDKARQWYEKAVDKGNDTAMRNLGLLYQNGNGVGQDYGKARQWYEKAADKGNIDAMRDLGLLYQDGNGVERDYGKARQWYEKAADKGNIDAMNDLGLLYQNGNGVGQDYGKARQWYEKAADKGNAAAMVNLGMLHNSGLGMEPNYDKARRWYEKAADKGNADARPLLEKLTIDEAVEAGRFADASKLQQILAARVEAEETKREGKPGKETMEALVSSAWYALFARDFAAALAAASRAHALFADSLVIETNRAHAFMFLGRGKEAEALYLAHKGRPISVAGSELWEQVIAADFAALRKAGLTHPMMAEVEKKLGVSR